MKTAMTVPWPLLILCALLLLLLATATVRAEKRSVVRIPTGTREAATKAIHELERVGLGLRVDRIRTLSEIELVVDQLEYRRLVDSRSSPLHQGLLPDPSEWVIVRNITAQEDGEPRPSPPAHNSAYLPVDKRRYHTSDEIEHILRSFSRNHIEHAAVRTLGQTARGSMIWALKISGHARGRLQPLWKPSVLLTGSLHGDDRMGREMCLWIAQYLCRAYARVSAIRNLLDRIDVYLVPEPSPDASLMGNRYTAHGVDLDRAFPDRIAHRSNPVLPEPEVEALMEWAKRRNFLVSASFLGGGGGPAHGGLVVRYPWNASPRRVAGRPERTPDDRALRYLARVYANTHPTLAIDDPRGRSPDAGTVNGADWYPRYGSMQDWLYHVTGSLHLDLVVSPFLKPLPQHLPAYWDQNHQAILALLRTVDENGLRGSVRDSETGAGIPEAQVVVRDMNDRGKRVHNTFTDQERGHFARYLVPGRYAVWAEAPGYHTSEEHFFTLNHLQHLHTVDMELRAH